MRGAYPLPRDIRANRDGRPPSQTRTSENQVVRPGEQDLYIKLTYSVIREDLNKDSKDTDDKQKKPPKWHMSALPSIPSYMRRPGIANAPRADAYFTKLTEGQLRTIDDIPLLRDLVVPEGIFRSARTTKPGKRGEGSRTSTSTVKRMYAPFPPHPTRRVRAQESPPPVPVPGGPSSLPSSIASQVSLSEVMAPPSGSIALHPPHQPPLVPAPSFYPEVNW